MLIFQYKPGGYMFKHREITDYTPNGHIVIKSLVVRLLW